MEDQNLIKAKMRLKKGDETNNCLILVSQTRASQLEEKREKKRGRRGRRGRRRRRRTKVCFFFCMESSVFWMSRVFGMNFPWMISYSFPRVLL